MTLQRHKRERCISLTLPCGLGSVVWLLLTLLPLHAQVTDQDAINAIIGEAGNQPLEAQIGVGEVIRKRNSLRGIYGLNNKCVLSASNKTRHKAKEAWEKSLSSHLTLNAMYFGGEADKPYFDRIKVRPVVTIGRITFYK